MFVHPQIACFPSIVKKKCLFRQNLQILALRKLGGILLRSPKVSQPLLPCWMNLFPQWFYFHNWHILFFNTDKKRAQLGRATSRLLPNCRNQSLCLLRTNSRYISNQCLTSSSCAGQSGGRWYRRCTTGHLWDHYNVIHDLVHDYECYNNNGTTHLFSP